MYYIYEDDKPKNLEGFFIKVFKIVKIQNNQIKIAPIPKLKLIEKGDGHKVVKRKDFEKREKTIETLAKKTANILNKTNCNKVILSKELKKEKGFVNYLYSQNLNIIDGKFLFKIIAPEVLSYIIKNKKIQEKELKIAILANDINEIVLGNIKLMIQRYKNITIVTRHALRLKKFQKDLYEKEGIAIAVTNNKRKAINKANVILNFDFPEEVLNKYTINENANIINFGNKVKVNKKRFNGTTINDYEIKLKNNKLLEIVEYDKNIIEKNLLKDLYEAQLYKKQSFDILRKIIKKDKVDIRYLLGNNMKY